MILTANDLRIIVREETAGLKQGIENLERKQTNIERDIGDIRQDQASMKQVQEEFKLHFVSLEKRHERHEQETHRQGIVQEDLQQDMRAIAEAVYPLLKKSAEMSDFDGALKKHDAEIKITKTVLKGHIQDKSIHRKPKTGEI